MKPSRTGYLAVYTILTKHFFRSKTVWLAFGIIMTLGVLSIGTGKQFLSQKQLAIEKTIQQQQKHIDTQIKIHENDLGLLLYYLKFSFINPIEPLAGISMGQRDLNSHIQNVSILNVEGQKYDTDLVNPMRLQVGNLDLSFLIIVLFPLLIIALNFNLLSEEEEKGTWKMIIIQGTSSFKFLLMKLSIRIWFIFAVLGILFLLTKVILNIPFSAGLFYTVAISYVYILFWFALCFYVILLRKPSNTNAIILLTGWLILVVFIPVMVNNYVINKYPIEEALTMTIKQRDGYHKKWDTDKKTTLEKFYKHYPQFKKYGYKEEGFSWLWYYAMQQMGDDESREEREAMFDKIEKRETLSAKIAQFFPPLKMQLSMNAIAKTSLSDHVKFLNETTKFHESLRLKFYPKIFENQQSGSIDWETYKPYFFHAKNDFNLFKSTFSVVILTLLLVSLGVFKNLKYFN